MVISEDPWHSHLLPSVWQWSCHYLCLRLRSVATGDRTPISCTRGERSTSTPPCNVQHTFNKPFSTTLVQYLRISKPPPDPPIRYCIHSFSRTTLLYVASFIPLHKTNVFVSLIHNPSRLVQCLFHYSSFACSIILASSLFYWHFTYSTTWSNAPLFTTLV